MSLSLPPGGVNAIDGPNGAGTSTCRRSSPSALADLGLDELADRFLEELSSGQRQRAFVAMPIARGTEAVLHDVDFAACCCDHVVATKNGRICRQDPPGDIATSDTLHAIYGMRMEVLELDIPGLGARRICLPCA